MSDPYRQHNSDGMINSLSAELEKVKAELVAEKAKTKELEQTLDDERSAINDGWEYKLICVPHSYENEEQSQNSSNRSISLSGMIKFPELKWNKGRTLPKYVARYQNLVSDILGQLGKQGWEMFHQDDLDKEIYWFRRKIKVKGQTE